MSTVNEYLDAATSVQSGWGFENAISESPPPDNQSQAQGEEDEEEEEEEEEEEDKRTSCDCECTIQYQPVKRRKKRKVRRKSSSNKTYVAQLSPGRVMVIEQDEAKTQSSGKYKTFKAVFFLLSLLVLAISLCIFARTFPKAHEILAVTFLLLFTLVVFEPKYFIPFMVLTCADDTNKGCSETSWSGECVNVEAQEERSE